MTTSFLLLTPTTELEAVNTIISTIGESPINSLSDQMTHDVALAINVLNEVNREIQNRGWNWNTDDDYPLNPDLDGEILVPRSILRVHFREPNDPRNVVLRGYRLYDRANHTYKFPNTLYATITFLLPFDELPEAARRFIILRAGRLFQDRALGSPKLHEFTLRDEMEAKAALMAEEVMQDRPNILNGTAPARVNPYLPLNVLKQRY